MSNRDPYSDYHAKSNSYQRTYTSIRETSSLDRPFRQVATPWLALSIILYCCCCHGSLNV